MSVDALRELTHDEDVIAIVGTAGTTDLGAIDPLDAIADRAQELGAWFHVDAAVGSGLTLSDTHRRRLDGIERANSITADLHKLWWMPFGASALLVPDVAELRAVHHASVYLNRPEDEAEGQLNLVGRSLDTSRRFDAFKVLVALRTRGRKQLGAMVDTVLDLTQYAGEAIQARPELELVAPPHTVMVAFRRVGDDARNIEHPPRPVRERRGGDRPHHRRRACRAQAHAAEPEHDTRADRRAAGPDQRSVSLTARSRPSAPTAAPLTRAHATLRRGGSLPRWSTSLT